MRLEYSIAVTGDRQLKNVLRSIETEAVAQARRGAARDQRSARTRVGAARTAARSETAIERERQRHAARTQAHEHRTRMMDHASRERALKRETLELRKQTREIDKQIQASRRRSAAMERDARRAQVIRQRTVGRVMTGAARTVGGTVGTGVRTLGGVATLAGGIAVGNAVGVQMGEQARASQLANQAGTPEIKGELLRESQGIRGFTGGEVLNAMGQFTDVTGDLETARGLMAELAQLSLATGASLEDLAAAAGNAFVPLADKIADPQKRLEELKATMRAIAGQGAIGAVEIKDLASEMAGLAAATNKFQGDPSELIKTVGAMAQAARQRGGAATSSEAVTSVSRFVGDVVGNAKDFEAKGISVFADKGKTQLRDPQEIIAQMLKKTGGDLTKVNELFGVYAERAVAGFSPLYTQAEREQKGSGEKAVQAEFARLLAAELSREQIEKQAASRLEDGDIVVKETMKELNREIGQNLLPEVVKIARAMGEAAPAIGQLTIHAIDLAKFLGDNPLLGLAGLIGASFAKELALAKIGSIFRNALEGMTGGDIPLPGDGKPGKARKGGKLGRLGRAGRLGGKLGSLAPLAAIGAPGAFITANVIAGYENQKQVKAELEANPGAVPPSMFNYSPYAAGGLASNPALQPNAEPGGPMLQKQKLDTTAFDASAKKMADEMRAALSEALRNLPAVNRTNPMNKRTS